jgi:GNAT superfamily N-acetyltransferase
MIHPASNLQLKTARLTLVALSMAQLKIIVAQPGRPVNGISLAADLITPIVQRVIGMKLAKMEPAPAVQHPWFTYWLIALAHTGIGLVGFKGFPDAQGQVEIGYGLAPTYRNRGYTTEAVQTLIDWAFLTPERIAIVAANTALDNIASHRVLQKVGLVVYHHTADNLSWRLTRLKWLEQKRGASAEDVCTPPNH